MQHARAWMQCNLSASRSSRRHQSQTATVGIIARPERLRDSCTVVGDRICTFRFLPDDRQRRRRYILEGILIPLSHECGGCSPVERLGGPSFETLIRSLQAVILIQDLYRYQTVFFLSNPNTGLAADAEGLEFNVSKMPLLPASSSTLSPHQLMLLDGAAGDVYPSGQTGVRLSSPALG